VGVQSDQSDPSELSDPSDQIRVVSGSKMG